MAKVRFWLYIWLIVITLNTCQTSLIVIQENCVVHWVDKIFVLIDKEYEPPVSEECKER